MRKSDNELTEQQRNILRRYRSDCKLARQATDQGVLNVCIASAQHEIDLLTKTGLEEVHLYL